MSGVETVLAQKLRRLKTLAKLNNQQIAKLTGFAPQKISAWMNDKTRPSRQT